MKTPLRVLFVENSEDDVRLVLSELTRGGYAVTPSRVETPDALRDALSAGPWDLAICECSVPSLGAVEALRLTRASGLEFPFIVVAGTVGEDAAAEALRAGACDVLVTSQLARLLPVVARELRGAEASRDITKRRLIEEQVRQARKMEAIGRLAGGIAHDFNNLLTTVLCYTRLVLRRLQPTDPVAGDIHEIEDAANQAVLLTQRLLSFSGRETVVPQVLDVARLVERMEPVLRRELGDGIVVKIQGKASSAKADRGHLEQILGNLADNARDAMPRGGTLTIELADVTVEAGEPSDVPPGPYVALSVSDTGSGMDAATQVHIFEPYFSTKPVGKGPGLGLSSVHGIVTQTGGHIRVSSAVGLGTTFRIFLPRVTAQEADPMAGARPRMPTGSETALKVRALLDEEGVRDPGTSPGSPDRQAQRPDGPPARAARPAHRRRMIRPSRQPDL